MCNPTKYNLVVLQMVCIFFIFVCSWLYVNREPPYYPTIGLYQGSPPDNTSQPYNGTYADKDDIPKVHVLDTNCKALFEGKVGKKKMHSLTKLYQPSWRLPDEHFEKAASNCTAYIKEKKYIMRPVSPEEANFQVAFTLVVYKNVHQIEQLLRAIYRPQNYYCIHVDLKAAQGVYESLSRIAGCFDNVFMTSKRYDVTWGMFPVLQPELQCMEDLLNRTGWRYLINLTGQEFPLKTNEDIVRILKVYNGSNAIAFDMWHNKRHNYRIKFKYKAVHHVIGKKGKPPHHMKITHGSVHVALTRAFVSYVLNHRVANDLLKWSKDTLIPDETVFQSLQVNPMLGVPGAFTGDIWEKYENHNPYTRYKRWQKCSETGLRVREICILGVHDMVNMHRAPEMFANKFFPEFQPVARMCLEERLMNRTLEQLKGGAKLDLTPYKKLSFVKNHAPS